jgi:hypothetical protein
MMEERENGGMRSIRRRGRKTHEWMIPVKYKELGGMRAIVSGLSPDHGALAGGCPEYEALLFPAFDGRREGAIGDAM